MYTSYYLNAPTNSVADLLSKDDQGFEDLLATAAENFPPDIKTEYRDNSPMSALSPFSRSSSSASSSMHFPESNPKGEENDLAYDSDSDVDQLDLNDKPISAHELRRRAPSVPSDDEDLPPSRVTATATFAGKQSKLALHLSNGHTTSRRHNHLHRPHVASSYPRRKLVRRLSCSSLYSPNDSDYEPGDDSESNATDDEYAPSSRLAPSSRRASPSSSTSSNQRTTVFRPTARKPEPKPFMYKRARNPRRAPLPRNQQSSSWDVEDLIANVDQFNFICPVCDRAQRNRRMPDFKRHLRTHGRPSSEDRTKGFWCKGVPLKDADMYGIPSTAERYPFLGEWRVGGCQKNFSRADALKRHLDNRNISCVRSCLTDG